MSDNLFYSTFDSSIPYFRCIDETITDVSNGLTGLTGYSSQELIGKTVSEAHKTLRINCECLSPSLSSQKDYFMFTKSYQPREIDIQIHQNPDNHERFYIFQEKLYSRIEEKFPMIESMLNANVVGVCIFYMPDIMILKANDVFLSFFDSPFNHKEYSFGQQLCDVVTGWIGSTSEVIWKDLAASGKPFYIDEYEYNGFKTGVKYLNSTLTPIFQNGKLKYYVEIITDITQRVVHRKQAERQSKIIREQKEHLETLLKMKDEFLYTISHEFKTPLNVINAAIQTMELVCKDELTEKTKMFISKIRQNNLRQLRLVNNLLDITRAQSEHIKIDKRNLDIVSLTKALVESVSLYAKQKDIQLFFSSAIESRIIGIDDEKYERILLNLLSNAIKFTPDGKSIHVRISLEQHHIHIEVEDEGIGIPSGKLRTIFERFGQVDNSLSRKAEGTGIGLHLVKLLVSKLDGSIKVESKEGSGSIFTLLFPDTIVCEEIAECSYDVDVNNRLIQSINIEFSDIY